MFSAKQKRVIAVCVALYTAAYFCRLNLSAALHSIALHSGVSLATAGLLQTVFAMVYACGQMVSGSIVDHVNPVRYILVGLTGVALSNLAMSAAPTFLAMIAAWTCNAAFQSMLWTPIVRIVGRYFTRREERDWASSMLSITLVAGHFGAWAISGFLSDFVNWRMSFAIPSLIAAVAVGFAAAMLRSEVRDDWKSTAKKSSAAPPVSSFSVIASASFLLILATCVLYGFVRDGVITWTPTILARRNGGGGISSTTFTLILPLVNILGVLGGYLIRRRGANPRRVVAMMMSAAVVCCMGLLFVQGMLLMAILLGLLCAAMYGANTMLTSIIPMEYDAVGKMGMTAGLIDCFIYLGSALAGVLGGGIYEIAGMHALCAVWIVSAVAAAMMMTASGKKQR